MTAARAIGDAVHVELSAKLLIQRGNVFLVRTVDANGAWRETWLPSHAFDWEWVDKPTGRVSVRLTRNEAERRGLIQAA